MENNGMKFKVSWMLGTEKGEQLFDNEKDLLKFNEGLVAKKFLIAGIQPNEITRFKNKVSSFNSKSWRAKRKSENDFKLNIQPKIDILQKYTLSVQISKV